MTFRFPIVGFALIALAGCAASPEQQVTGNYLADPNRLELPDMSGLGIKLDAKQMDQVKKMMGAVTLKLRADKTFILAGMPGRGQEGTWSLKDDKITLVPKNAPKKEGVPQQAVLTRNPKNNELTLKENAGFGEVTVVLVKNGS